MHTPVYYSAGSRPREISIIMSGKISIVQGKNSQCCDLEHNFLPKQEVKEDVAIIAMFSISFNRKFSILHSFSGFMSVCSWTKQLVKLTKHFIVIHNLDHYWILIGSELGTWFQVPSSRLPAWHNWFFKHFKFLNYYFPQHQRILSQLSRKRILSFPSETSIACWSSDPIFRNHINLSWLCWWSSEVVYHHILLHSWIGVTAITTFVIMCLWLRLIQLLHNKGGRFSLALLLTLYWLWRPR